MDVVDVQGVQGAAAEVAGGGALVPEFRARFVPAVLEANFSQLMEWARGAAGDYDAGGYDPAKEADVAQAKRDRAWFNGLTRDVDQRRKAVKAEYERPLKEFEAGCREVTAVLKSAAEAAGAVVDGGERVRKARRREELAAEWADFAGALAEAVPYDAAADPRWLNKSVPMARAVEELRARAAALARDWERVQGGVGEPFHDVAEREFLRTLDVGAALAAQAAAREQAARAEALRAATAPAPALEPRSEQSEPAPQPVPAPAPPAVAEPPENWRANLYMVTRAQLDGLAAALDAAGVMYTLERM